MTSIRPSLRRHAAGYSIVVWLVLLACVAGMVAVIAFSVSLSSRGWSTYYEVECTVAKPVECGPSGRTLTITRDPVARRVRVDLFDADGRLWTSEIQEECSIPDVSQFACRKLVSVSVTGTAGGGEAPWRLVANRLYDARERIELRDWIDPLTYWRRTIGLGSWTP